MPEILLIPLAADGDLPVEDFAVDLGAVLFSPVTLVDLPIPLHEAYDKSRRQYHSGMLLTLMLEYAPAGDSKLLGITGHDLFLPVLTYVFGQAQLASRACVFSSYRLRNELYGLPPSPILLRQRSFKEALHELGHTYGLRHCSDYPCVMNTSTYAEDIDLKPAQFCDMCWITVNTHRGRTS